MSKTKKRPWKELMRQREKDRDRGAPLTSSPDTTEGDHYEDDDGESVDIDIKDLADLVPETGREFVN